MPDRVSPGRARAATVVLIAIMTWVSVGEAIAPAARMAKASGRPQGVPPAERQVFQSVIHLFDRFPIVALGETHWIQNERDFETALVQAPGFANAVNDVVMECGNARYQGVLDRYVAGEDVPYAEVQQVWRNTTQTGRCDSPDRAALIEAVRTINRRLPPERRIRILAGAPAGPCIQGAAAWSRRSMIARKRGSLRIEAKSGSCSIHSRFRNPASTARWSRSSARSALPTME